MIEGLDRYPNLDEGVGGEGGVECVRQVRV